MLEEAPLAIALLAESEVATAQPGERQPVASRLRERPSASRPFAVGPAPSARRPRRLLAGALAVIAAAAGLLGLRVGAPSTPTAPAASATEPFEITPEAVCSSEHPDDVAWSPAPEEPTASLLAPPVGRNGAVARADDDYGACSLGVARDGATCGGPDPQPPPVCDDTIAWCTFARP